MAEEAIVPEATSSAGLLERFLAFAVDLFLIRLLAVAFYLGASGFGPVPSPGMIILVLLAVFVAYHAGWKGASPGARLVGLRARTAAGEPLDAAQGFKRALAWGLYDRFAGTRVVRLKPRSTLGKVVVYGASAAILFGNLGLYAARTIAGPEIEKAEMIGSAQQTLNSLALLQSVHKVRLGSYTDDIVLLAGMSDTPEVILKALPVVFDGGKVTIVLGGGGFTMTAKAQDAAKTTVSVQGPAAPPSAL